MTKILNDSFFSKVLPLNRTASLVCLHHPHADVCVCPSLCHLHRLMSKNHAFVCVHPVLHHGDLGVYLYGCENVPRFPPPLTS